MIDRQLHGDYSMSSRLTECEIANDPNEACCTVSGRGDTTKMILQTTSSLHGTFRKAIGISLRRHLKCSNVIGQRNCLLLILGISLAGIRRSFVVILPNIGP